MRNPTVEELEVVDETIFVGAAVDAADKITRYGFVVQLSKIRTLENINIIRMHASDNEVN
jgi:hypothetical protein